MTDKSSVSGPFKRGRPTGPGVPSKRARVEPQPGPPSIQEDAPPVVKGKHSCQVRSLDWRDKDCEESFHGPGEHLVGCDNDSGPGQQPPEHLVWESSTGGHDGINSGPYARGGVPLTFVEHLREVLGMVERNEWTGDDYQHSSNRFFVTKYDWENVVTAKEKCESMKLVNEIVVVQLYY